MINYIDWAIIGGLGSVGALLWIFLGVVIGNSYILENKYLSPWITCLGYILFGGLITLGIHLIQDPTLPEGFIWFIFKGLSWPGMFIGSISVLQQRRRTMNTRGVFSDLASEED